MEKLTKIYLTLITFSFLAFLIAYFEIASVVVISILLVTTFIKGYLVIEHFMDLKEVDSKYRYIPSIWLACVILFIALGYYI